MVFSKELTDLFIKGGQVVYINQYKRTTILVRMPKGEFIQDDRNGQEDNSFEYAYAQNYTDEGTIHIAGYRNGNLKAVKNLIAIEHTELIRSI